MVGISIGGAWGKNALDLAVRFFAMFCKSVLISEQAFEKSSASLERLLHVTHCLALFQVTMDLNQTTAVESSYSYFPILQVVIPNHRNTKSPALVLQL